MTWVIGPCALTRWTPPVWKCVRSTASIVTPATIPTNQLLIDPSECIDCALVNRPWETIYQDEAVPEPFKQFIEINARVAGRSEVEETPKYDKPQPAPGEVRDNRDQWLSNLGRNEP